MGATFEHRRRRRARDRARRSEATAAPCPPEPRSRVRPAAVRPARPRCSDRRCPVTTEDEVMRLLERADPVRERGAAPAVDSASYLDALRTRSNVTTIETTPTPTRRPSRHRRPILITAAAAVAAIVVGALALTTRDNEVPQIASRSVGSGEVSGKLVAAMW